LYLINTSAPKAAARPCRLDFKRWPTRYASPAVPTYPAASLITQGVEALPQTLTIGGVDYAPAAFLVANDVNPTTGAWVSRHDGSTTFALSGSGAAPAARAGVLGAEQSYSAKWHQAPSVGAVQIGADDFVVEAVVKGVAKGCILATENPCYGAQGIALSYDSDTLLMLVGGATGFLYAGIAANVRDGHFLICVDRTEKVRAYRDGALTYSGSISDVAGTITAPNALRIGNMSRDAAFVGGAVAQVGIWNLADNPWPGAATNAAVMGAVAAARYAKLIGRGDAYSRRLYSLAAGSKLGTVATPFSIADLTVASACTVAVPGTGGSWHWGSNQPRLIDGGLAVCPAEDHLLLNSGTPTLCWPVGGNTGVTVAAFAGVGPSGVTDAASIVETVADDAHITWTAAATVVDGSRYCASLWLKPLGAGGRRVLLYINSAAYEIDLGAGTCEAIANSSIVVADSGWMLFSASFVATGVTEVVLGVALEKFEAGNWEESYLGDGASGVLVAEPGIRLGASPWPYAETGAAAVSSLATVYDWADATALARLSRGRVRLHLDFNFPQYLIDDQYGDDLYGPVPLLSLWQDSTHWLDVSLNTQTDLNQLNAGDYWGIHVNSNGTDPTGENLGCIGDYLPPRGTTLRLILDVDHTGAATVSLIRRDTGAALLTYRGTLASWAALAVAKVRLGCDNAGAGQRHLIIEKIEVL
jgi:hypothetical protein